MPVKIYIILASFPLFGGWRNDNKTCVLGSIVALANVENRLEEGNDG